MASEKSATKKTANKINKKSEKSLKSTRSSSKSTRSGKTTASKKKSSNKSQKSGKSGRSEKSSKSQKSSRKEKKPVDGIRLMHSSGEIYVKEADLVAVSTLMKMRQSEGRLGKAIDLRQFGQECVFLMATYITKRTVKGQVSFFSLAEVFKLSKAFVMDELHKKMEEVLVDVALQSGANLIQALLVNDVSPVSRETELQLHYLGAWAFLDLVRLPDFHKIPPNQFMQIFASCELNVPHELVAVDAALYWLAGQPQIDILAPAVFALVRSAYLGPTERGLIVERTAVLNFPEPVVHIIKILLDSRATNRICLEKGHIARHIPRCGVADPSHQPAEATLPISRPREGLLRLPKAASSKSEKSKTKRSAKKSTKSGKSQKSAKSSKSSKSERSGKKTKKRPVQKKTAKAK